MRLRDCGIAHAIFNATMFMSLNALVFEQIQDENS